MDTGSTRAHIHTHETWNDVYCLFLGEGPGMQLMCRMEGIAFLTTDCFVFDVYCFEC